MSNETITVQTMGEDGDQWLVTGTTDAHSADEAVRQHIEHESGETIEALLDADELVEFHFYHSNRWHWATRDSNGQTEWISRYSHVPAQELVFLAESSGSDSFAGYLVSAA